MAGETEAAPAGDDRLSGGDLQGAIETLRAMGDALDAMKTPEASLPEIQEIGRIQAEILSMAGRLATLQIDWLAGEQKVTAEQTEGAVRFADGVIEEIADVRKRIRKIAALVAFLGIVTTGNGVAIVKAAVKLKKELD